MRVRVTPTTYTYPDVIVVCGEAQFADSNQDILLNPTLDLESIDCTLTLNALYRKVKFRE